MDVATATVWLGDHTAKYGGDPERIFLMGHSAGAHLVSLVGTNGTLLERAGGSLEDLRGVISLDTAMYNVPLQMEVAGESQRQAFGEDPAVWRRASPWHYVEAGKGIPPFLVFISDGRAQGPVQPIPFTNRMPAMAALAARDGLFLGRLLLDRLELQHRGVVLLREDVEQVVGALADVADALADVRE